LVDRSLTGLLFLFLIFSDYHCKKYSLRKTRLLFLAAITWFVISVVLLTLPGSDFPSEDWLDKIYFDKWVHIGMFSIMVVLWCLAWRSKDQNYNSGRLASAFWTIAVLCLVYGIIMEFVQKYYIPLRSFDVSDIAADAVGSLAGVIFSLKRYIKK
jgi:VanZ family protein